MSIDEIKQIDIPSASLSEENISSEEKPPIESLFEKPDLEKKTTPLPPSSTLNIKYLFKMHSITSNVHQQGGLWPGNP